jgi:hypothetical protein
LHGSFVPPPANKLRSHLGALAKTPADPSLSKSKPGIMTPGVHLKQKDKTMFEKTAFVIGLLATTTISGAALAGNSTYGYQTGADNGLEIATDGDCNYTSIDQDGYWLHGKIYSRGIRNSQVVGQAGYGSAVATDVRGYGQRLGIAQNADHAYADVSMRGSNNGAAIYQNRSGSEVSVRIAGRNNTAIIRGN